MKRLSLLLFAFLATSLLFAQTIPDREVIQMVQSAHAKGMGQQEISVMLTQKGVTKEQILRLKAMYEKGEIDTNRSSTAISDQSRMRQLPLENSNNRSTTKRFVKDEQSSGRNLFESGNMGAEFSVFDSIGYTMGLPLRGVEAREDSKVFGRNIFRNQYLTFEPQLNIATPEGYILGPGDEVIIDVWGASEKIIRKKISPDGNIQVEGIGPIYLSGLTVKDANNRIKGVFSRQGYSGIEEGNTFAQLTLGAIRSIQVNVMGEVVMPGTYTVPSLASVFHLLYCAGGVSDIGSLRSIKVYRKGKVEVEADVYDFILEGKTDQNISLQDGDVIVVSPYQNMVKISGEVKRPMFYEMRDEESLEKLLNYTGGFTGDAYTENVRVVRKSGRERQVFLVEKEELGLFLLEDGDQIGVDPIIERFSNKIEIRGAVYREGVFGLNDKLTTVKQLLEKAEGVKGDAFLNRSILYREKPDYSLEALSVDLQGILSGEADDIVLRENDVLYIPSIHDLREEYTATIKGAIRNPGVYPYVENMTIEDLVLQSGGLLESASTAKVDIARRIKDPKSMKEGSLKAETYTLSLKDGLVTQGEGGFILQPFDEIYIRTSPNYQAQRDVRIAGEVMFSGEYALTKKGERLSHLVAKAGGLSTDAYTKGARLMRKTTPQERELISQILKNAMSVQNERDTLNAELIEIAEYYSVGIELNLALENPGSNYDVILKEGDRLIIPEYNGTVRMSGGVMFSNTVVYKENAKLNYYINQAGGYTERAKKKNVFVVHMNGTIVRGKKAKILPGSEIIVPLKSPRKGGGFAEIMGITSTTASLAAIIASIVNMSN